MAAEWFIGTSAGRLEDALGSNDVVEHGEVDPDVPVTNYLRASVGLPTYSGKEIPARQVAKETSGLRPVLGDATDPASADNPFEGFTPEKFYAALTNCQLTAAPGRTRLHAGVDGWARRFDFAVTSAVANPYLF